MLPWVAALECSVWVPRPSQCLLSVPDKCWPNEQKSFLSFDLSGFPCFSEFQNHRESLICHSAFTMANIRLYNKHPFFRPLRLCSIPSVCDVMWVACCYANTLTKANMEEAKVYFQVIVRLVGRGQCRNVSRSVKAVTGDHEGLLLAGLLPWLCTQPSPVSRGMA